MAQTSFEDETFVVPSVYAVGLVYHYDNEIFAVNYFYDSC